MKMLRNGMGLLLLAALLCTGVQAAPAGTYELEELSLEVTVPEGLCVLEQGKLDQDGDLERLGLSAEQMEQSMETQNIYLELLPEELTWELGVIMAQPEEVQSLHDFNLFNDAGAV